LKKKVQKNGEGEIMQGRGSRHLSHLMIPLVGLHLQPNTQALKDRGVLEAVVVAGKKKYASVMFGNKT
jgi:hypothetical protein